MSDELLNQVPDAPIVPGLGAFAESLKRNNSKIKADRAEAISEDAQLIFKRKVEDIELEIKKLQRERNTLLDLSPTNTQTLVLASDFDSDAFVNTDIEIGIKLRNLEIKHDIAKTRYEYLFGKM